MKTIVISELSDGRIKQTEIKKERETVSEKK